MAKPKKRKQDIIFTGALGDIICLLPFMSPDYRRSLRTIYWAGKRGNQLAGLFQHFPEFDGAEHRLIKDIPDHKDPYYSREDAELATGIDLTGVEDWSIGVKFPQILAGRWTYHSCPFLENQVGDIKRIDLPTRYVAIQGASLSNSPADRGYRDLLPVEWERIVRRLARMETHGVVINIPGETLPRSPWILDRRGYTIGEGIEMVRDRRCVGYMGIDSWLSVFASHRFTDHRALLIRSRNYHYMAHRSIYAAPHPATGFCKIDDYVTDLIGD